MPREKKPRTPELERLGQRIKDLRVAKGYASSETFAFEHGLSRVVYGRWESGEDMRYSSLLRVAAIHNLSLEDFFHGV